MRVAIGLSYRTDAKNSSCSTTEFLVTLKLDGDDFEIVGHEDPGSVGRKGTGRKAAAEPN
ncbi:MAG: hypothetical protein IH926_12085 [Proteobacteria bacterium]|nr:hypothetical protein [Pseudomonadota bacterium]